MSSNNTKSIPVSKVLPYPGQPRKDFDQESLESLAESIKSQGLIQPIIVKESLNGYMIVDGERRWRAHQIAKIDNIPSIINNNVSPGDHHLVSLIANFNREGHTPMETSNALAKERRSGKSVEDLAKAIGKSIPYVYQHLALQNLHPDLQKKVSSDRNKKKAMRVGMAVELSKLDRSLQIWVYDECKLKLSGAAKIRFIKKQQKGGSDSDDAVRSYRPSSDAKVLENFATKLIEGSEKYAEMPSNYFRMMLENLTPKQKRFLVSQLHEGANSMRELAQSIDSFS